MTSSPALAPSARRISAAASVGADADRWAAPRGGEPFEGADFRAEDDQPWSIDRRLPHAGCVLAGTSDTNGSCMGHVRDSSCSPPTQVEVLAVVRHGATQAVGYGAPAPAGRGLELGRAAQSCRCRSPLPPPAVDVAPGSIRDLHEQRGEVAILIASSPPTLNLVAASPRPPAGMRRLRPRRRRNREAASCRRRSERRTLDREADEPADEPLPVVADQLMRRRRWSAAASSRAPNTLL